MLLSTYVLAIEYVKQDKLLDYSIYSGLLFVQALMRVLVDCVPSLARGS